MPESSSQRRERMSEAAAVPADKPKVERNVDFGRGVGSVASGMTANEASSQVTIAMLVLGATIIVGHGLLSQFRSWVESRVTDNVEGLTEDTLTPLTDSLKNALPPPGPARDRILKERAQTTGTVFT